MTWEKQHSGSYASAQLFKEEMQSPARTPWHWINHYTCLSFMPTGYVFVASNNKWWKNFHDRPHHRGNFSLGNLMWHLTAAVDGQSECWLTACGEIPTSGPLRTVLGRSRRHSRPVFLPVGRSGSHLIHSSLGHPSPQCKTASYSVQLFLQGLRSIETDWVTDHATLSVVMGCI